MVEAIGRNSNLGHLCENWSGLRKSIDESPARTLLSGQDIRKPRSKHHLSRDDVTDMVHRYGAGETTQQIGNRYGISKTRVATVLREQDITIRRQGLTGEQTAEVVKLYAAGESLARLGVRFGVSHATIAALLRDKASNCGRAQDGVSSLFSSCATKLGSAVGYLG
jgi:hypothetical protein